MAVGSVLHGQKKEVLIVERYMFPYQASAQGIYIYWEGKEPEKVECKGAMEGTKIQAETFAKLYQDGWEIVACQTGGTGNAMGGLYQFIFQREKP